MKIISKPMCKSAHHADRGFILVLTAILISALLIFASLVVDVGILYTSESALQAAADASALAAARNYESGVTVARQTANDIFLANFNQPGISNFAVDPQNIRDNLQISLQPVDANHPNASAEVTITGNLKAFFARAAVGAEATKFRVRGKAVRSNAIVALVIDASSSMIRTNSVADMGAAVNSFISHFSEPNDRIGVMLYGASSSLAVPINTFFNAPISALTSNLVSDQGQFQGWTAVDQALEFGAAKINDVALLPGEKVKRVIVLFTDGLANAFKAQMECTIPNYTNGTEITDIILARSFDLFRPSNGLGGGRLYFAQNYPPPYPPPLGGCVVNNTCQSGFYSFPFDPNKGCVADTVYGCALQAEAERRAVVTATSIHNSGISVFAIGLGDTSSIDSCGKPAVNPTFLDAISGGTGAQFAVASQSSQLSALFDNIASYILVQLTE